MNVLSIGAGAIGTYIGGSLAHDGHQVLFVDNSEVVKVLRQRGVILDFENNSYQLKNIFAEENIQSALTKMTFDFCLLAIKSYDTDKFIEQIKPFSERMPLIVCLQNGVENEDKLIKVLGLNKVIPATITSSISKINIGSAVVERNRGLGISANHPFSSSLKNTFNHAGINTHTYRTPNAMKWSKMLSNLLGNASSAILNLPPIKIFAHPGLFRLEIFQIREAIKVMQTLHFKPVNLPGTPIQALSFVSQYLPLWLARMIMIQIVGKGRGGKMPSFHIDLYSGSKQSEVDFLNGAVVRFGEKFGVNVPVNKYLNETLIKLITGEIPKETYAFNPLKLIKEIEL